MYTDINSKIHAYEDTILTDIIAIDILSFFLHWLLYNTIQYNREIKENKFINESSLVEHNLRLDI